MQIKAMMSYHFTPTEVTEIRKLDNAKVSQAYGNTERFLALLVRVQSDAIILRRHSSGRLRKCIHIT